MLYKCCFVIRSAKRIIIYDLTKSTLNCLQKNLKYDVLENLNLSFYVLYNRVRHLEYILSTAFFVSYIQGVTLKKIKLL